MNFLQKLILVLGALAFIIVIALYPAEIKKEIPIGTVRKGGLLYQRSESITRTELRTDIGTTALRGIAVIVGTTALFLVAGKRKETEEE
jgi:hypothetical protein